MDSAWISAFSAVMGSLVGAFTSFVTTYANQRAQYRRDFLSKQFAQRENLYSEFIHREPADDPAPADCADGRDLPRVRTPDLRTNPWHVRAELLGQRAALVIATGRPDLETGGAAELDERRGHPAR
jgi:hypothetical protein